MKDLTYQEAADLADITRAYVASLVFRGQLTQGIPIDGRTPTVTRKSLEAWKNLPTVEIRRRAR